MAAAREWDKGKKESPQAYAAFCLFADMPPASRSVDGAYRLHKPGSARASGRWQDWSRAHSWRERADAKDNAFALQVEAGTSARLASVRIRRAVVVDQLLAMVAARLDEVATSGADMTTAEVLRLTALVLDATKEPAREDLRIEHVDGGTTAAAALQDEIDSGKLTPAEMVRRYQDLVGGAD